MQLSKLYRNTGNGFEEDTSVMLPGVVFSSVAWADYNGDSKPDFLLMGSSASNQLITKPYKNTGSSFTEDTSVVLPGVYTASDGGSVTWADYNGDGKPDFLLAGMTQMGADPFDPRSGEEPLIKLYSNTGSEFIEDTSVVLPRFLGSSVGWADYNGDGKIDFLLTGILAGTSQPIAKLYQNTGNGFIEDTSFALPGTSMGSVTWADYNNDGHLTFY